MLAERLDRVKFMMRLRNVLSTALIATIGVHALLSLSPRALSARKHPAEVGIYGACLPQNSIVP